MIRHDDYRVRVLVDGALAEGRGADVAVLVKALVAYADRVSFATAAPDGTLTPIPDDELVFNDSLLLLQNVGAQPDTVRGVIATVAGVAASRERVR